MSQEMLKIVRLTYRAARFTVRDPRATWVVLRMAFWVALLTSLVKLFPLQSALSVMTPRRRRPTHQNSAETQDRLGRLIDLLLAIDFWVFTPTCWKRAPVLHRFLALHGIETRIVFGVRKDEDDALSGHAWLESSGQPVLETTPPNYKVTFSHPV
jgi:Transglutaminase-like superfamily